MPPAGKSLENVRFRGYYKRHSQYGSGKHNGDRCDTSRTKESKYKECDEEDRCRTEVGAVCKDCTADKGKDDEHDNVSSFEKSVQSSSTRKNIGDFGNFRKLHADAAYGYPVNGTVLFATENNSE